MKVNQFLSLLTLKKHANEIIDLSKKCDIQKQEIIAQRQENIQAAEKAKKSKDIIESQLKNIVEGGGIGAEACELTV